MKNFTLILCGLLFSSIAFSQTLTINVEVCNGATEVRLTGPWWGWDPNGGPLASDNGNGTWKIEMPNMTSDMEYLLVVDGVQENLISVMANGGTCAPVTDYSNYANRKWLSTDPLTINNTYGRCDACSTTSQDENAFKNLAVFPNPTSDYLIVSNNSPIDRLRIVNIFGSVVFNQKTFNNLSRLDLSTFSPGVYFVTVFINNQEVVRRITVK